MGAEYRITWRQPSGAWVDPPGAEWRSEAEELSRAKATSAVWFSLLPDSAWLVCFHEGVVVRELRFAAELGAWAINRGAGMPFENVDALALWLRAQLPLSGSHHSRVVSARRIPRLARLDRL